MPLQPHTPSPIVLPVSDRHQGDTLIRQKAQFETLLHGQSATGECMARITVRVTLYAADGEGYGPPLSGLGFTSYTKDLEADNRTLVDAATGATLAIRQGENEAAWLAIIDSFEQPTMLQGDFFEYLRDNGLPGTIRQMIEHHIQQADALGRFA